MEYEYRYGDEGIPIIDDVVDVVKTARYQFGTLAHMGEDLEHSVVGLREWLAEILTFFSKRRNVVYTAVSIISATAILDFIRGWTSVFGIRFRIFWPHLLYIKVKHRFGRSHYVNRGT